MDSTNRREPTEEQIRQLVAEGYSLEAIKDLTAEDQLGEDLEG